MASNAGYDDGNMTEEEMLKQISDLKAELSALRAESRVIRSRRTRLTSLSGENCDFVEALPSRISVKELRAKVAESKNMKISRVQLVRADGQEPVADEEEVRHELRIGSDMVLDYCSIGDPLHLVLLAETRIAFTGRVKCKLNHGGEYTAYQRKTWVDQWVDIAVEVKDLGVGKNEQLRIFIGSVDLVRYGELDNPHIRQLETFGNKCAGEIIFRASMTAPFDGGQELCSLTICRRYVVEMDAFKQGIQDESQIWFAEAQDLAAFLLVCSSWQRHNPQPTLKCDRREHYDVTEVEDL